MPETERAADCVFSGIAGPLTDTANGQLSGFRRAMPDARPCRLADFLGLYR